MRIVLDPNTASHIVTIDLSNLVWRCSEGLRKFRTSKGVKSGHIYGAVNAVATALRKLSDAPNVALIISVEGRRPQHRLDLLPEYKGNRPTKNKKADEIFEVANVLTSLPVSMAWNKEYEADDVMASVVAFFPKAQHLLVTTDHDLFALVNDRVSVLYKKDVLGLREVEQKLGFPPSLLTLHKALYGDKSDNIPPVKGVKKARTWPKMVRASKDLGWKNKLLARLYRKGVNILDLEQVAERAGVRRELEKDFDAIRTNHAVVKLCTPPITIAAHPNLEVSDFWLKHWELTTLRDRMMELHYTCGDSGFIHTVEGYQ